MYTLPILKYACESLLLNNNTLDILNVCWNIVFRKVFKMNRWEFVKMIQFYCGRMDFIHIHHFENWSLLRNCRIVTTLLCRPATNCFHIAVSTCYKLFSNSNELKTLSCFYDVPQDYSINFVKGSIYKHFKALCNLPN